MAVAQCLSASADDLDASTENAVSMVLPLIRTKILASPAGRSCAFCAILLSVASVAS